MTEPRRVELTLLGQTVSVRTSASAEYLQSLAAYIEERVGALRAGGIRDTTAALSLAALDIVDELFQLRDEHRRQDGELDTRLESLMGLLDRATRREGGA